MRATRLGAILLRRRSSSDAPHGTALLRDIVCAEAPAGGSVLLHVPSGTYLKLDQTATVIVDLLVEYGDIARTAAALAQRFSIPFLRAEADVVSVIDRLSNLRASRTSEMRRPPLTGAFHALREWLSLPASLRLAVVKVTVVVLGVEAGLRTMDIGRLATLLQVPLAYAMTEPPEEGSGQIGALSPAEQRAYWATGWVLDRWVFRGTCLRRALVAGYFLRRHHPVLRLGLVGDGSTSHAWVVADGMTFNTTAVTGTFSAPARHLHVG